MKNSLSFLAGRCAWAFIAVVLPLGSLSAAAVTYVLAPGPYVSEDLGSPLRTNTQEHQIMYRTADNHRHLQMYYDTFGATPMDLVDIDVDTGQVRQAVLTGNLGRPGPQFHVYYPGNNKTYIASSDPGSLSEFDPVTGAQRFIRKLEYKGAQYGEVGDDGWIYIGQITSVSATTGILRRGAGLERFHPLTGAWQDLGVMDPTFNGSLQYAYTLGADTRYVYIGLGQLPWYLAIYDTQATSNPVTLYWKNDGDSAGRVYHGLDGLWYYERGSKTQSWTKKYYRLTGGVPVEISALPAVRHWSDHGNTINELPYIASQFQTTLDLDDANPNSANGGLATIRWKVGAGAWQSTTISGLSLAPSEIKRLYDWPGRPGKMLGWASNYGLVFSYDTTTQVLSELGYPTRSLYHATFSGSTVFFSGYPSSTLRYDTNAPWTLSASTMDITANSVNPYRPALTGTDAGGAWQGKYNYYSAMGNDGLLYIGVHHERDTTGGGLGWYNPTTGTSGGIREPFLDYDVRDVVAAAGGAKIVYASSHSSNIAGKLFVLDCATKTIERIFNPIPNNGSLDKLVAIGSDSVVGITSTMCYRANILTGTVTWAVPLGGAPYSGVASYDRRLVLGPDGFIWLFIDTRLSRIDPATGAISTVLTSPVAKLTFQGADLYTTAWSTLKRYRNIVVPGVVNHAPVANDQSVTVSKDVARAITVTGIDVEGAALTYAVTTMPTHGVLSGSVPALTYTPTAGYLGTDLIEFTVSDGVSTSTAGRVGITVSNPASTSGDSSGSGSGGGGGCGAGAALGGLILALGLMATGLPMRRTRAGWSDYVRAGGTKAS